MSRENARSCLVSVAALMAALLAISVPADSVLAQAPCPANPSNVATLPSYSITAVACGLNFPTAMTFYQDPIWVAEEGTPTSPDAVKHIDNMGNGPTNLTASELAT